MVEPEVIEKRGKGKPLGIDEIEDLKSWVAAGYSDTQIADAIRDKYQRDVDRTTIWRNRKKLPPTQPEDRPWQWEQMNDYGLPWEASRVLMDCWTQVMEEESGQKYPRPFTVRLAKWCFRVNCACPGLQTYYLLSFARDYSHAEMASEVLGKEIDTINLTAYLAIQPDESDSRAATYHHLVDLGLIEPLPFGTGSRGELELEARLYPDDPSAQVALEQLDSLGEGDSEEEGAALRAEFQRRQAIMRENWEKMGSPEEMSLSEDSELLPGEIPSLSDLLTGPPTRIRLDFGRGEETELC